MIKKYLKKRVSSVKLCAVITAVCFMASTFGANLYAIPMSETANKKYEDVFVKTSPISNDYGKITSSKDAQSTITVVNIQDLHCHPQTQRNISKIINQIADKYNVKKIYVEGGYGNIDTSWLSSVKDENIRKQVTEELLQQGILTGSEYYKITSGNKEIELKGIDDEKLHEDNIKRLAWLIQNQNKYKDIINKVNTEINILEKIYVNGRNEKFTAIVQNNIINPDTKKFYKHLLKYIKDINENPQKYNNITAITLNDYPNIKAFLSMLSDSNKLNVSELKKELQDLVVLLRNKIPFNVYSKLLKETNNFADTQKSLELINSLCKKENIDLNEHFKEVVKFLDINSNNKNLNPVMMVREERKLIGEIRKALSYNTAEYEVTFISDFNKYFQDYLQYKLTQSDWECFKKEYAVFRTLYGKYSSVDRIKEIEQDFAQINKYYEINDKRNDVFVKNLLNNEKINTIENNKIRNDEEILKDSKEIIIAVTGGFHSQKLEEILQIKKVNTIVVTPVINEDTKQANEKYIELIEQQSKINYQALAYKIASCTTDSDKKKILYSAAKQLLGDNTEKLKEVLGKDADLTVLDRLQPLTDTEQQQTQDIINILNAASDIMNEMLPLEGGKTVFVQDIDSIILNISKKLVENGIFFSNGVIFEIENSQLNGKQINGIPAEIYSRMHKAVQEAMFESEMSKQETADVDFSQEEQDMLYEDTGANGYTRIYLEDINNNPQQFVQQIESAIKNNKLIVLNVFKKQTDIDTLSREEQIKMYQDIREMFFKLYTQKPLYSFISKPENESYLNYDIHFFLLEILENAFLHGNKGLDRPIFVYMNLNEQNEIDNLKIYNKNSQEDANFPMRMIRMKLALLGGQHKSNVLMKQNPYRTFAIDDNFQNIFYKVSSEIKTVFDVGAVEWLESNNDNINYFSVFSPLQNRNQLFNVLSKYAHVWEEIAFRAVPAILSLLTVSLPVTSFLTVPLSIIFFTACQSQFIKAHNVGQWIKQNNFEWSKTDTLKATLFNIFPSKELKESFDKFSKSQQTIKQTRERFLPTLLLSAPYVFSLLFIPNIPLVILSTVIAIGFHKFFNSFLKVKMNIFENYEDEFVPSMSDFLTGKDFIDLSNEKEKQDFINILNNGIVTKEDARNFVEKLDLNDISQSNYLSDIFAKKVKILNSGEREIIEALVETFNVDNAAQFEFVRNILFGDFLYSIDEQTAEKLVNKLNFDNETQLNALSYLLRNKVYHKRFTLRDLNMRIMRKINVNDYKQLELLKLFSYVDDNSLYSFLSKIDFDNKQKVQYIFNLLSNYDILQHTKSTDFILSKLNLQNSEDFKILQSIVSFTKYINAKVLNDIFKKLNLNDKINLTFAKTLINKKNTDLETFGLLSKYFDLNDSKQVVLLKYLIEKLFAESTVNSVFVFYENIQKGLEKINFTDMSDREKILYQMFTDGLIARLNAEITDIQNDSIRAKDDKMIIFLPAPQIFNKVVELSELLEKKSNMLSQQSQIELETLKNKIELFKNMRDEKVTIEDFAQRYDFNLLKQTPNTFFDSNRYSFTKLLDLLPVQRIGHKVRKHVPSYFMERKDIDKKSLKKVLSQFDSYMKLLDENLYVLSRFESLTGFDSQFDDVVKHIDLMIDYLSSFNQQDASYFRNTLNNILDNIKNQKTTIEEQKQFASKSSDDITKISTINTLINRIHQKANLDFVLNIRKTASLSLSNVQNVFVSKEDRTIKAYDLSENQMNPEIKRLLLLLIENPDFSTYDKSQIFIKDNIFLWNGLLGDHSARVLIDFSEENKNIFVDFSEAEKTDASQARIHALRQMMSDFGFISNIYQNDYNNNSLIATINKDTGLNNDTDICDLAQKAMILLSNAASLYRTDITREVIDAATLGIMDLYRKCFFITSDNNFIKTRINNAKFFNNILSYLHLPNIPSSQKGMISNIRTAMLFARKTKTLGQYAIDQYVNKPIEQGFATGYLTINKEGYLEQNLQYNPLLSMTEKIGSFINESIRNSQEIEMLNQGTVISQIPEQNLNLTANGQLGGYLLKSGYIKLVNGSLNSTTKGEYLSIKVLVDKNGIARYTYTELVGFPDLMNNQSGRQTLTSSQLEQILKNEGYEIANTEPLTDSELITYRKRLQENITGSTIPTAYGTLISKPRNKTVVNAVAYGDRKNGIYTDRYANPDNVAVAAQYKMSLFAGGSYSSHAGIVLREYKKTAMIVNDSKFANDEMTIKFYQPKGSVQQNNSIQTREIEEIELTLQPNDIVLIDTKNKKIILFANEEFKNVTGSTNILMELQNYIDNANTENIKSFIEKYRDNTLIDKIIEYIHYQSGDNPWLQDILSEYGKSDSQEVAEIQKPARTIKKTNLIFNRFLSHPKTNTAYKFGEKESVDETIVGTKAANQAKLFIAIEQLKQDTGISDIAVTDGLAIDYKILESLLGQEYINLYRELESLIKSNKKDKETLQKIYQIASKITELIDDISNSKIKEYIGKKNLRQFKNQLSIVRSSGVGEDGKSYSAAGVAESYGKIEYENISQAIRDVLSSFFAQRAIEYMINSGNIIKPAAMIEEWVDSDKAGIMMSEDTNGNRIVQVVNGQGEDIVSGRKTPYSFVIDIESGEKVDGNYTNETTLTSDMLSKLTKTMQWLEQVEGVPVDIEFLIKDNIIYIVQVRPVTALDDTVYDEQITDINQTENEEDEEETDEEPEVIDVSEYDFTLNEDDKGYPKKKSVNVNKEKKTKTKSKSSKKAKNKKKKSEDNKTTSHSSAASAQGNNDIRQPQGFTLDDILDSFTKLAQSKDSFDSSLNLGQQQTKDLLVRMGLSKQQVDQVDFSEGLPDYIVSLLKSRNSQVTGVTINQNKTLIENLQDNPILFSMAIETLTRVYESVFDADATFGDLLSYINQRYLQKCYEATCTDLRGYFGEIYAINTLVAGIIPDKRAGPIIIRPELPEDNNIRGFDIYDINGVKIQIKTGGSGIVHHHFSRYWSPSSRDPRGIIAIPVLTTKNIKNNSFANDNRVQGLDVTTEAVTKFSHDFISALHGISYKRNIPSVRNLKLKDLINSFKGAPTDKSITKEQLIDLLTNKTQVIDNKKTKKEIKQKEQHYDNVIYFNQQITNVSDVFGQNIVVRLNNGDIHILYIDRQTISLNEKNRKVLEEEDFSSYGIREVEYDENGIIKDILFDEGTQFSVAKVDGEPAGSKGNNLNFSQSELNILYSDTNTDGYIDVYLDGDIDEICHLIKKAATENKLIIFHMFENGFNTSNMSLSQIYEKYKKAYSLISSRFNLSDIFPVLMEDRQYTDFSLDFFMEEMLKNALVHGNLGRLEDPIAVHINLDKDNNIQNFVVYNTKQEEHVSKDKEVLAISAHLTGDNMSSEIMRHNPIRKFKMEQINAADVSLWKASAALRTEVDMQNVKWEQDYKNVKENIKEYILTHSEDEDVALQQNSTVRKLYVKGLKKYINKYLKETGKEQDDLTSDEIKDIKEKALKYRYTLSGIIYGVWLEKFSIYSKDFIPSHGEMTTGMKIAVYAIRVLSLTAGIFALAVSSSFTPALGICSAVAVSVVSSTGAAIMSGSIMHLLWNILASVTNNKDYLLQQNVGMADDVLDNKKFTVSSVINIAKKVIIPAMILSLPHILKLPLATFSFIPAFISVLMETVMAPNTELIKILKPVNLRKEIKHSELPESFVSQARENGSKFISIYDFVKERKKLKRKDFRTGEDITKYRARTYVSPIHRRIMEQKNRYVENSFGFALGLSYTNIFDEAKSKVNLVQAISEMNNIISWERGYEYFYGPEYPAMPPEEYMDKVRDMCLEYDKKIFFFLPRNLMSHDLSFKTRREIEYIQQHPEMMKNVVFVFGTYDCFNITEEDVYQKYFDEENIFVTLKKLLSSPDIYIDSPAKFVLKFGSLGLVKFIRNMFRLSFDGIIKTISVLINLEFSGKQSVTANNEAVLKLREDIANDNDRKVCFICTANINRSAVSHLLFEDKLLKAGVDNIDVVSAGFLPVSQRNNERDLLLGQDYKKLIDGFDVDPDLIENFSTEEFSRKHIDSDYFIVVSQKHKNLLINEYNIDPAKIILYSDMDSQLKGDALPDPQKLKISKTGMINLINNIFDNSLFNFIQNMNIKKMIKKMLQRKTGKVQSVAVNYQYISTQKVQSETVEIMKNTQIDTEQNFVDVYIVEDIEKMENKYELINTGIKVDGVSIYKAKVGNLLMYGAKNISEIKVIKAINESELLKQEISDVLQTLQADEIETEGIIKRSGESIGINEGVLEVGAMDLAGKTLMQQKDFMLSALEVKRVIGIMYGQKVIVGLENIGSDINNLRVAIENGRARKVITAEQYEQLNLTAQKISELKENGIDIYIDIDTNEIDNSYMEQSVSGLIRRKDGKTYIYDYFTEDETELQELKEQKDLDNIEQKIINSDTPIMIDIEMLKTDFQGRNIIEAFARLETFIGKIRITMGLGNINRNDIESVGYGISFDKIPNLVEKDIDMLLKTDSKDTVLSIIGEDKEFGIILNSLKDEKLIEKFIEIIKERILAKNALIQQGKEYGLKDKNMEKILGKMLIKQIDNKDKETINIADDFVGGENNINVIKKINEEMQRAMHGNDVAVNTIIQIILFYGDDYKAKQITTGKNDNIANNYRAMLAAA